MHKLFNSGSGGGERPRLRAPAFTDNEDEALVKAYFKYRNVIRGRNSMGVSQRARSDAWEAVAAAVNEVDGRYDRTVKSVKIHYGNMLAEYKAFKSNDKNARAFQENQIFYKYFDELLTEKERAAINADDGHADDFAVRSADGSNLSEIAARLTAASAYGSATSDDVHSNASSSANNDPYAAVEGGESATSNQDLMRATLFAAALYNDKIKGEERAGDHASDDNNLLRLAQCNEGGKASASNSAELATAVPYVQSNSYNLRTRAATSAAHQRDKHLDENNSNISLVHNSTHVDSVLPQTSQSSSMCGNSCLAPYSRNSAHDDNDCTRHKTLHASSAIHKRVARKRIVTLRTKILERQLEVLTWKSDTLRKKNDLLDLKILKEKRILERMDVDEEETPSSNAKRRNGDVDEPT